MVFDSFVPPPGYDNYIRVLISDVDTTNQTVHAFDKTGALIQALYSDQPGGTLLVPAPNEIWTAIRRGYSWYLVNRLDTGKDLSDLGPGSLKLEADNIVLLGERGEIGGNPWGATVYDRYYNASSGFDIVTLSTYPVGEFTILPYLNGLAVSPHLWTYNPETRQVQFSSTVGEIGELLVFYQTWKGVSDDQGTVVGKSTISGVEEFTDV